MKKKIVSLDQRIDDEINGRLDQPQLRAIGPHELVVGRLADLIKTVPNEQQPIKRERLVGHAERRTSSGNRYVGWAPSEYLADVEASRDDETEHRDIAIHARPTLAG